MTTLQGLALEALRQQQIRNEALKQLGAAEAALERATAESKKVRTYDRKRAADAARPPIRIDWGTAVAITTVCSSATLVLGFTAGSVWKLHTELPPINSTQPQP